MRGSSRQAGRRSGCSVENARVRILTWPLSNRAPGVRMATIRREGSEAVKDRASARMPLGSSADRATCSRPDAGPRLSGGRTGPAPGGTGGRTGRSSPATTRQRPGAEEPGQRLQAVPNPGPAMIVGVAREGIDPAEEGPAHDPLNTVINPDLSRDHDLRAIPPCHARILHIGAMPWPARTSTQPAS